MTTQPTALRYADRLEVRGFLGTLAWKAADELRRLHAEVEALHAAEADFHTAYRMKCDEQTKALHAEVEALRADAERLAWMIENQMHPLKFDPGWVMADEDGEHEGVFYPTAQAAIDAARERT
jgi:hypothetical protein